MIELSTADDAQSVVEGPPCVNCGFGWMACTCEIYVSPAANGQTTPLTADQVELGRFMGRLGSVDLPPELLADDGRSEIENNCSDPENTAAQALNTERTDIPANVDKCRGFLPDGIPVENEQCEHFFGALSDYCEKCGKDMSVSTGQDSTFDQDTQTKAKTTTPGSK